MQRCFAVTILVGIYLLVSGHGVTAQPIPFERDVNNDFDTLGEMQKRPPNDALLDLMKEHRSEVYLLYPEDREFPIRMRETIPVRWFEKGPSDVFAGQAQPGEYYTFQIGLWATWLPLNNVVVTCSDLIGEAGSTISAGQVDCFNTGGIDERGRPFTKNVSIPRGEVQAFWFGVPIPRQARGRYEGSMTFQPVDEKAKVVRIILTVTGDTRDDHGDSELWRHSRLRWLNSTVAIDDDVTAPYTPLRIEGQTLHCLGRTVTLDPIGLPHKIQSSFSPNVDKITTTHRDILASPIRFVVDTSRDPTQWSGESFRIVTQTDSRVEWESVRSAGPLTMTCRGAMEYEGHLTYRITLCAREGMDIKDIRLEIPFRSDVAKYLMGMGHKGSVRPKQLDWKWDRMRRQDSVWVGDVNAGLRCQLKGPDYRTPFSNDYYYHRPVVLPTAWHNGGVGGCRLAESGNEQVILQAYSGPRRLEANETLHFDFELLITPVKPLDLNGHWNNRYYHGASIEEGRKRGANVLVVHHGHAFNPFINYPFMPEPLAALTDFVRQAHEENRRVKLYYTSRELGNRAAEIWALRSLGDEIIADGRGNDEIPVFNRFSTIDPWLQTHFRTNYIPSWVVRFRQGPMKGQTDASVLINGDCRWNNYYLEGLKWLLDRTGMDGLYIDETYFDRQVMRRARKILDRHHAGCLIDLHICNPYTLAKGNDNGLNDYMDRLPYIDSLWLGEEYDYDEPPDYWLIEISGIPFGLTSEMLQGGGNPWRGMVFGMVSRSGLSTPIWKLWDAFGIAEAEMIGFWASDCPVKTDHKDIPATVYRKKGQTLVSLASWATETVDVRLKIDWPALGLDPQKSVLHIPAVEKFQDKARYRPHDPITVEPGKGYLIIIGAR